MIQHKLRREEYPSQSHTSHRTWGHIVLKSQSSNYTLRMFEMYNRTNIVTLLEHPLWGFLNIWIDWFKNRTRIQWQNKWVNRISFQLIYKRFTFWGHLVLGFSYCLWETSSCRLWHKPAYVALAPSLDRTAVLLPHRPTSELEMTSDPWPLTRGR